MTAEIIEGEAVEVPQRALVPVQPGQVIVTDTTPDAMLERAAHIATALATMVERQRLYTTISGKKYPHVEAWQTIGRMDNVVAREAQPPIHHEDGSYEAFVELVRLSDGLVIGSASALCGAAGDNSGRNDWTKRADHHKRSMAVTRATSRAFRLQYAWIMALAGYEPTPADEMPDNGKDEPGDQERDGGLIGTVAVQGNQDLELRQSPDGMVTAFRLRGAGRSRAGQIVMVHGPHAEAIHAIREKVIGQRIQVWGTYTDESFVKDGETVAYRILHAERIETPDVVIPPNPMPEPTEAESVALFDDPAEEEAVMAGMDKQLEKAS